MPLRKTRFGIKQFCGAVREIAHKPLACANSPRLTLFDAYLMPICQPYWWPITCNAELELYGREQKDKDARTPIKDVIRDLQLPPNVVVYGGMVGVLSAISGNVLYEKQTKLDVEEAIVLRGAA